MTYPDATTETYVYEATSVLKSYTNNRSQQKQFFYDALNRLTSIRYPDSTTIVLQYDPVGNLVQLTERNGDVTLYTYDALNRVTRVARLSSTGGPTWYHGYSYDAEGNRTAVTELTGSVYGTARFGDNSYATFSNIWAASGAYDSRNRLPGYTVSGSETTFDYDVENRPVTIAYLSGVNYFCRRTTTIFVEADVPDPGRTTIRITDCQGSIMSSAVQAWRGRPPSSMQVRCPLRARKFGEGSRHLHLIVSSVAAGWGDRVE